MLNMPVAVGQTLLSLWARECEALAAACAIDELPLSIHVDATSAPPAVVRGNAVVPHVEVDRSEFRGTGGILRDLSDRFRADDLMLVASAHQLVFQPITDLFSALAVALGDIAMIVCDDGTPCSLSLVRCGTLRALPARGFIDFKEQALPALSRAHPIRVIQFPGGTTWPLRTLESYITGLRMLHGPRRDGQPVLDPFAEDWKPAFSICEPGAVVEPSARIHDSVVLKGAHVGQGAMIVRSVLCAGARIAPGEVVADRVVAAGGAAADRGVG